MLLGLAINAFYITQLNPKARFTRIFFDSNVNKKTGCDFYALYLATKNFTRGKNIYGDDPQHKVVPCHFGYRYLPIGLVVGAPFAAFTPKKAYQAWIIFLELLVLVNVLLLWRVAPTDRIFGLGTFLIAAGSPLYLELYMGQYSLLQATFLFAALTASQKGQEGAFAGFFGASLLWKLNTWIALPALLIKKRWKIVAVSAALILLTTVPYVLWNHDAWDAIRYNFEPSILAGFTKGNHGLLAFVMKLLPKIAPKTLVLAVPLVVVAVALIVNLIGRGAHMADMIALWMAAYFLAYKHVWEHHYVMLVPVIVILAVRYRSKFLLLPGALTALPTIYYYPVQASWSDVGLLIYHGQKPLAAMLVFVFAAIKVLQGK